MSFIFYRTYLSIDKAYPIFQIHTQGRECLPLCVITLSVDKLPQYWGTMQRSLAGAKARADFGILSRWGWWCVQEGGRGTVRGLKPGNASSMASRPCPACQTMWGNVFGLLCGLILLTIARWHHRLDLQIFFFKENIENVWDMSVLERKCIICQFNLHKSQTF